MASITIPTLQQRLRELLRERSVTRGDFILASGRRSSFYIDARRTTMSGEGLAVIGALGLARLVARGWAPDLVGGLTLGADPVAYAIAAATRSTCSSPPRSWGCGDGVRLSDSFGDFGEIAALIT